MNEFGEGEDSADRPEFIAGNFYNGDGNFAVDDMRDSSLLLPQSSADAPPAAHVEKVLAPSAFNPEQFEGRLPADEAESLAAAQTLALAYEIPRTTYPAFYDHDYIPRTAPPYGIVSQGKYEGVAYDGVTTARVLTARQQLISTNPSEERVTHAVIVYTFNEAGEKTRYVRYRSSGKGVLKDTVDLVADSIKPYAHEASEETIRAILTTQIKDRAGMRADAVAAGLMDIPVTLDEVNHLITLVNNHEPRIFSFGQLYNYISKSIEGSSFDPAALSNESGMDSYLEASAIAMEAEDAAHVFARLVRQTFEQDATLEPPYEQQIPLNSASVPRNMLECRLTTGYDPDTHAPYMCIICDTAVDETFIEGVTSELAEEGVVVPDGYIGREHRAELTVTIDERGYLTMQHRESFMNDQNDPSSVLTYINQQAPADMRLVSYMRNFARKPVYALHPNIP